MIEGTDSVYKTRNSNHKENNYKNHLIMSSARMCDMGI